MKRKRLPLFEIWSIALITLLAVGVYAAYLVFAHGLIVTGMDDVVVWGIWITADLSFIALSAGAFMASGIVYLFRAEKFKPILRVAILIGLIGYLCTLLTLVMDIGRPERFYYPFIFPGTHSVMWEIYWCITIYTTMLVIEIAPVVGESEIAERRFPFVTRIGNWLHKNMIVFATIGIFASLLHQASLGALYGIIKAHPVWYKPTMPILFIISAMAAGPCTIIVVSMITSKALRREVVSKEVLYELGKISGFILVAYLVFKGWDMVAMGYAYYPLRSEQLALLSGSLYNLLFWGGEIIIGGIVPAIILAIPRLRRTPIGLFTASILVMVGLVLFRFNVNVYGLMAAYMSSFYLGPGRLTPFLEPILVEYVPTWVEWAIFGGVVAFGALVYTLGVKYLPLFTHKEETVAI